MRNVARLSNDDRADLFRNTADRMQLHDSIVEKDFWGCYMLEYLFHRSSWKNVLAFKGGTSLSKAFHLINRFSEDIDLVLDWRMLGYRTYEPWANRSNTKQAIFNKEATIRTEMFLADVLCPTMQSEISRELGREADIYIDGIEKQTVRFNYPHVCVQTAIPQVIRLEFGALAAWNPIIITEIESYASTMYPAVFERKATSIVTVTPERTFWEKATILHHEAHRPTHLNLPSRYSRHYYDLYRMSTTPVKDTSFSNLALLAKVVDFKMRFYPRAWANYETAIPKTLKLIPPSYRIPSLRADYESMRDMLFQEIPSFDCIMEGLSILEMEIHTLSCT